MRVSVYFNLHRRCYSIRAEEGQEKGRVIAHARSVGLVNVGFKVSEAGRQRVLREGKKNVHAFVTGDLAAFDGLLTEAGHRIEERVIQCPILPVRGPQWVSVTYNPYKFDRFVERTTERPVLRANAAVLNDKGVNVTVPQFNTTTTTEAA